MNNIYEFLDAVGTREFSNIILDLIDQDFLAHTTTDPLADNDLMPTSKASLTLIDMVMGIIKLVEDDEKAAESYINDLYPEFIRHKLSSFQMFVYIGRKEDIENPRNDILYLIKENESDEVWIMYVYLGDGMWYPLGETHYELLNFWAYSDTEALQGMLVKVIPDERIKELVISNFNKTQ